MGLRRRRAAVAPNLPFFLLFLLLTGAVDRAFQSMAASSILLWTDLQLRGRVVGMYVFFIGGTPTGAPLIGLACAHFGARTAMAVCGIAAVLSVVPLAVALRRRVAMNRA